jgi:sensor c-di-GMP phosphodiesterase-like protein
MAESLGLDVVAEGVEDEAQLAFLRERGCPHAQGFLFSRAVEPEAFLALLEKDDRASPAG